MSADIYLYKGDTGIGRLVILSNEDGATDLTDADVLFFMGNHEIKPRKLDDGKLLLTFETVHTEKAGFYSAVFKVHYSDGRIETYPSAEQPPIKVYIKE